MGQYSICSAVAVPWLASDNHCLFVATASPSTRLHALPGAVIDQSFPRHHAPGIQRRPLHMCVLDRVPLHRLLCTHAGTVHWLLMQNTHPNKYHELATNTPTHLRPSAHVDSLPLACCSWRFNPITTLCIREKSAKRYYGKSKLIYKCWDYSVLSVLDNRKIPHVHISHKPHTQSPSNKYPKMWANKYPMCIALDIA